MTSNNTLTIPPTVTPSISETTITTAEDSLFAKLYQIRLPTTDELIQQHALLDFPQVLDKFENIIAGITTWLEAAHLAAFTLEQNIKQEIDGIQQTEPLETACNDVSPLIQSLIELGDIMEERQDAEPSLLIKAKLAVTKIQSEWSGLQHFISSVKRAVQDRNEKIGLQLLMEGILVQIDDLSTMMFQFQEKRHQAALAPSCTTTPQADVDHLVVSSSSSSTTTTSAHAAEEKPKEDTILVEIDNRVGPLFNDVEKAYTRMTSATPPNDPSGLLTRKHMLVQEKWESLRVDIDELKVELKEDRWLVVFRQVADQVDSMMDNLDKTVTQCYTMIHQMKEWSHKEPARTPQSSSSSTSSTGSTTTGPVDLQKLRSVEKNFEAKYKYYTPSITKMLMMLGNGIAARVSRNVATLQRHETMLHRWNQLKSTMDMMRKRDLPDIEKSMFDRPISPAWSRQSDHSDKSQGNNNRFKSPEPLEMLEHYRSGTPSARSKSPYSKSFLTNSPTFSSTYEDFRGKSATPTSSGRDSSLWRSMNHRNNSPSPVYGRSPQQRTTSPLSYGRESYPLMGSGLRPSTSDSSSVSSSPSRPSYASRQQANKTPTAGHKSHANSSKTTRHELAALDSEWRTTSSAEPSWLQPTKTSRHKESSRAKTPTPNEITRPKSSMARQERIVRSTTPSLIPRPKTPGDGRCSSPSLIPRPRSSMARTGRGHQQHQNDSEDETPSYLLDRETPRKRTLHKQYSVPHLKSSESKVAIAFKEPGKYVPDPKDPLDREIARIINASPITIKCQRAPQGQGRYYFGNELSPSLGGGKKVYTCKLMIYSGRRGNNTPLNKVLIRVGGGWQDLEIFFLEHMNLMGSDVVVRSFVHK
ncbi:hypothetical protein K501DRAFT_338065 [Backusella circina FSU 941]|nr:hypothetical protein K501DRAFT_338065 [Backusella circina FSU 941]